MSSLTHDEQTALCRVLQFGEYIKVGESRARRLKATIIAATSTKEGDLKLDFVKRFGWTIRVPAVRDRKEDIPLLARHFALAEIQLDPGKLERFLEKGPDGKMYPRMTAEFVAALVRHPLPGNARDVDIFVRKALVQSPGDCIERPRELAAPAQQPGPIAAPSSEAPSSEAPSTAPAQSGRRAKCTREEVGAALEQAEGSVQRAALILGVPRRTLRNWMEEYGVRAKGDTG